ncbi:thioester reductase domain-containing protein [Actinomadura graeca]|uniref:Thioester reductase domain-containing protein n=1 Tax=Actinomadura graeca TaxID=2750812 RepID=A0ABX8QPS0_9ACTN|nr:carboxylic acid reductase [Actinomadura graeca]QXJ19914.1 thioester reductase domain-containing protein [Actinomadura graeca]
MRVPNDPGAAVLSGPGTWESRLERRVAAAYATDGQLRAAAPDPAVAARLRTPGLRQTEIIAAVLGGYADRPALGQRAVEATVDPVTGRRAPRLLPRFDTITYRELAARVGAAAGALGHGTARPVRPGDRIAIAGFTGIDYTVLDLVCPHLGAVCVPLPSDMPDAQLAATLAETAPRVLAVTPALLARAVGHVLAGPAPALLLVFGHHPGVDDHRDAVEDARRRLAEAGSPVPVETLDALIARGRAGPAVAAHVPAAGEDPPALLLYTSGSTGTPKGAVYSDRLAGQFWGSRRQIPALCFTYMTMGHGAGRGATYSALARGGTVYFTAREDKSTLFEDIALVRPTEMPCVPRLCELVFQRFHGEVARRMAAGEDRARAEREVTAGMRGRVLGDRLLMLVCGTAPLSAELRAFTEALLDLEVHDGYGSTEAGGGLLFDHRVQSPPVLDYRIADVPELGYFRTDRPHPRGELLLKTTLMFQGYYGRPDLTAGVFDADGFYRTGDIVAETGPGRLVPVDRRNNVVKLAQGEFVAVAALEAEFARSPLIRQIFLYGGARHPFLLGVVVPSDAAAHLGGADEVKAGIGASLREIARAARLGPAEIPRDLVIEPEPFSARNGLLSEVGKPLRAALTRRYADRLERRYADMAAQQAAELRALHVSGAGRPTPETVARAARAVLGGGEERTRPDTRFTDLGMDSLAALEFATLLTGIFGVEVPVSTILGPATDLGWLAAHIDQERAAVARRPTAASVHGTGSFRGARGTQGTGPAVRAADLILEAFLDAGTLAAARALPPAAVPARTVLLTGGNGYLGRFLCLELLRRARASGGTVVCLVRGRDAEAARGRLDAAFDSGDPELLSEYRDLARHHLAVLAGDVGRPRLGLPEPDWRRLAETVDLIVHSAAHVNHLLPYAQLFGPNVTGTAEIIRLALTTRRKPVAHLSTVAATDQAGAAALDEDDDIRLVSPVRVADGGHAGGYGTSKWAGEVLLREAHEKCGLPVTVFRPAMIGAHTRYTGQLNTADTFTRLLFSLLVTGVAPKSWRHPGDDAGRPARVEGLPVDVTAAAVAALGARTAEGWLTYHVIDPHTGGIDLDEVVDRLIATGHPIRRIDGYADWLTRFEGALRALPAHRRALSVLPVLDAYRQPVRPGPVLSAARFRAAVRSARPGPGDDVPGLTTALIDKYVDDLRRRRLLDGPPPGR